jgi:hypothetical protein
MITLRNVSKWYISMLTLRRKLTTCCRLNLTLANTRSKMCPLGPMSRNRPVGEGRTLRLSLQGPRDHPRTKKLLSLIESRRWSPPCPYTRKAPDVSRTPCVLC